MHVVAVLGFMAALQAQPTLSADLLQRAEEKIQAQQLDAAEALLQQAVRQSPANTDALYRLGYVQYRRRELTLARTSLTAVLKLAPPAYNSRYFLGRISLAENKPKEAIEWLEPVVASGQTSFDAASQLASAYAAAGQPHQAVPVLKTAISQTPWDGALYYRLGRLYKQTGEDELATDAFETSTRLKSATRQDVETLMRTSELVAAGKPAEAIELSARVLERPAPEPDTLVALGVILANAKLPSEALKAFERAAALDANLFQGQFNYGLALLKLDRARDALAPLRRAFELLPQSQEAAMTLGLAAVMDQRYAEAIGPLELAWKRDPGNARLGALVATAYFRTGAAAKAVPVLRTISGSSQDDPAAPLLLVEALDGSGDSNGALETALQLPKRFPRLAQAHFAAAQQLVKSGRYTEAGSAFEEVLKLNPGQREAELGLADSLQKSGRHEAALDHYRAAGGSLPARLGMARSLAALKQLEQARKVLEEALPEYPSDPTLRVELSRVYARLGQPGLAAEQAKIVERLRAQ
jgi:tetratricopeptide (TPR) repeat protein